MKNLVKSVAAAALIVASAGALVACDGGGESGSGITGTYSATQDGMTMSLIIKADNDCAMSFMGVSMDDCTYTANGNDLTITIMGESGTATVSGNTMTLDDGTVMTKE